MSTTFSYGLGILTVWLITSVLHHQPQPTWHDLLWVFVVWLVWDIGWFVLKMIFYTIRS